MEFFNFLLDFLSYIMLSYFIFQIFGRKRYISLIVFAILIISSLVNLVSVIYTGYGILAILYTFIVDPLPIILALFVYLYLTRSYRVRLREKKPKGLKLKNIYSTVFPTKYIFRLSLFGSILSGLVIMLILVNYYLDYTYMSTLVFTGSLILSGLIMLFSIYQLYSVKQIDYDRFIVYIGKHKEKCYAYDLKEMTHPLQMSDVFTNQDYLCDEVGVIKVYQGYKLIEKNYLYWIATSQDVEIKIEGFQLTSNVFKPFVEDISKYQRVKIKLQLEHGKYILDPKNNGAK